MADSRFFVDVFGDIVDSMRATGTITDSVEVSGTYTLTTVNTFSAFDSISILDVDYLISSATGTTITISAATGLDFTGKTWKDLAPYYDYGHYMEIAARLSNKIPDPVKKFRKFPLIILVTDLKQKHGESTEYDYSVDSFAILIVNTADKTHTSQERTELNFKPVLYPLYTSLIEKMVESIYISVPDNRPKYDHIDHYGWGNETVYGNTGLILNEYLDAIEINPTDMNVYKNIILCDTISI